MTHEEVKELVARRVAEEIEAREVVRNLETLNENEEEQEGNDLTAYTQRFQELILLCTRMVPDEEDRVERFIGGLPDNIQGNVIATDLARLQDAIRIANQMESNPMDNHRQQPPFKRQNTTGQNVARAYTARNNERKGYVGSLPYCSKCKLHHEGLCTIRCGNYKKIRHQTRDCRVTVNSNTQGAAVGNPQVILIRPGEEIPIGRLYRTYPGGPRKALTVRNSVRPLPFYRLALRYTSHHLDHFTSGSLSIHSSSDHSPSRHFSSGHSLSGHTPPDTIDADSSTPPRFIHPSLARTLRCSEAYLRWRYASLSTMYLPTTFESSARDSSFESSVGPSHKRCRSFAATMTSSIHATRALVPSRADLLPPRKRFRESISPEDSVEEEIDTDRLEQVEEGLHDIYDHVIEIPLQRIEDIVTGQRELEARSMITGG
nr:hypothetical protein [Tanacetum cinerariifolium]